MIDEKSFEMDEKGYVKSIEENRSQSLFEQIADSPSFRMTDDAEESDHSDDECNAEKYREVSRVFHLDYLL